LILKDNPECRDLYASINVDARDKPGHDDLYDCAS